MVLLCDLFGQMTANHRVLFGRKGITELAT